MSTLAPIGIRRPAVAILVAVLAGCAPAGRATPSPAAGAATTAPLASAPLEVAVGRDGSVLILGRIVTMADPPVVEAVLIEDGIVTALGRRDAVVTLADDGIPVVDLGDAVAYPGFIDAHAHWIGDRDYYGLDTPEQAMDAAVRRGWTSISEQWVNQERIDELEGLAAVDALTVRVDAYLALNYANESFGDWYADRAPGPVDDRLRVQGLKIHLDDGWGKTVLWEAAELRETIARADAAGWQVSVHSVSRAAGELVLDAFDAAIGPAGPNPRHHRIEHAVQVTDDQLDRLVAMDVAVVIHLDNVADWVLDDEFVVQLDPDDPGEAAAPLARWRDFIDAGLHVAAASDAPWFFPDFELTDDIGRPVDQIAAGMDGRGREYPGTPDWMLDQLVTAEQALRAVTLDAAYALGDEARRGHLAPGALGDVTILSGDVLAASPDEIRAMSVVATIVGGSAASCADPAVCRASD